MKIKMIRFYCGYLNDNRDFLPDEEKVIPDDVSAEAATQLIERGFAVDITPTTKPAEAAKDLLKTRKLK